MNPIVLELAKTGVKGAWHWITRTLSILAVIGIGWAIYAGIIRPVIKPKPTESYAQVVQSGGINYNIEIYNPEDIFFLGIKAFGLKFGVSRPTVKKIKEIVVEIKK